MDIAGIITAALAVGGVGAVIGIVLGVAGERFKVEVDEREIVVRNILPGNNCGACGYPGCDGMAKAIVAGEAAVNGCPVAGSEIVKQISTVMGQDSEEVVKKVAVIKCQGTCNRAKEKYEYTGLTSCRQALVAPGGGAKACSFGCLGLGSCVEVCPFGALSIRDGIACVDKEKCVACGKCISACPKLLIALLPETTEYVVRCNSHDKGKAVKAKCEVGCIGCGLCVRSCNEGAIQMHENLAVIDQEKCVHCGACVAKCPVKAITN